MDEKQQFERRKMGVFGKDEKLFGMHLTQRNEDGTYAGLCVETHTSLPLHMIISAAPAGVMRVVILALADTLVSALTRKDGPLLDTPAITDDMINEIKSDPHQMIDDLLFEMLKGIGVDLVKKSLIGAMQHKRDKDEAADTLRKLDEASQSADAGEVGLAQAVLSEILKSAKGG